jgi:hypothetical protein
VVIREYPTLTSGNDALLERDLPRIITGQIEKWDLLIIAIHSPEDHCGRE